MTTNGGMVEQRRGETVLCTIPRSGLGATTFYDGADATSSAFAAAIAARRSLSRDDDAIAAGWAARVVRRAFGSNAVEAYDDKGDWTVPMEETFANGFVAFLRHAAWSARWPPALEHWRSGLASMAASCPESAEDHAAGAAVDDAMRALYARVVAHADQRGALPFSSPATVPRSPYATAASDPAGPSPSEDHVQVRKRSTVIGQEPPPHMREAPVEALFAGLDAGTPRRFGPAIAVLAAVLVAAALGVWVLYALVLRPTTADAAHAGSDALASLGAGQYGKLYEYGAPPLRAERFPEFAARLKELEHLGKMVETKGDDARVERDSQLGRTARVSYSTQNTFGHATIAFRFVDVGFSGEWRLASVTVEATPELVEPPYDATDEGADALIRRILYAFELGDYDEIDRIVPSTGGHDRLESFRRLLIGDGHITLVQRIGIESQQIEAYAIRIATYRVESSREQRAGTITLYLTKEGSSWLVRSIETKMNYVH